MQEKRLVFFQGNTQYENTGDILINKSLITLVKQHASLLVNDRRMPDWYVESLGLTKEECISNVAGNFYLHLIGKSIRARLSNSQGKVYLIGGAPGHEFGSSFSKAVKSGLVAVLYCLLQVFGVRIFRLGFSIGPIGKAVGAAERFRSAFMKQYFVRDSLSLDLCHNIGIKKARFFPDLAWLYNANDRSAGAKSKIILSFRHAVLDTSSDDHYLEKLKANLFSMLESVKGQYSVEVVYQVKRDFEFCSKLYDELRKVMDVTFREEQITLDSAANAYGDAYCILTNRLHVALLGYKYGGLPLILTDSESHLKIKGIYSDAEIDQLILDTNNAIERNVNDFNSLLQDRTRIMEKLNDTEHSYKLLANSMLTDVFK